MGSQIISGTIELGDDIEMEDEYQYNVMNVEGTQYFSDRKFISSYAGNNRSEYRSVWTGLMDKSEDCDHVTMTLTWCDGAGSPIDGLHTRKRQNIGKDRKYYIRSAKRSLISHVQ